MLLASASSTAMFGGRADRALGLGAALALRLAGFSAYRVVNATPATPQDLERLLRAQSPRLLLVDSALAENLGLEMLRHLRRAAPAVDWLLLWDTATPRGFELAVACHARGCIEWQSSPEQFVHAFRTVIGGELWFPRRAMQSLYFSLLAASEPDTLPPPDIDVGSVAERHELTEREAQALALMRQGLTNQQIADRLGISINTVKKHLAHAFEKRGLHHRRQLLG